MAKTRRGVAGQSRNWRLPIVPVSASKPASSRIAAESRGLLELIIISTPVLMLVRAMFRVHGETEDWAKAMRGGTFARDPRLA